MMQANSSFIQSHPPLLLQAVQTTSLTATLISSSLLLASLTPVGITCTQGISLAAYLIVLATSPVIAKLGPTNLEHGKHASPIRQYKALYFGSYTAMITAIVMFATQYFLVRRPFLAFVILLANPITTASLLAIAASTSYYSSKYKESHEVSLHTL